MYRISISFHLEITKVGLYEAGVATASAESVPSLTLTSSMVLSVATALKGHSPRPSFLSKGGRIYLTVSHEESRVLSD